MIPMHPLNVRGKPKKLHRGKAKPRAFTRADFAKTQWRGVLALKILILLGACPYF
jgi:hypothetical protein